MYGGPDTVLRAVYRLFPLFPFPPYEVDIHYFHQTDKETEA